MAADIRLHGRAVRRVAVIDDTDGTRDVLKMQLEDGGFHPVVITAAGDASRLARVIQESADAAVCDHRLSHGGTNWAFSGADLVARLFHREFPALLVTQYLDADAHISIRRWRRAVPVLLSRNDADSDTLRNGLKVCVDELRGVVPESRMPYRTLVRISDVREKTIIDAVIPAWNPRIAVTFPAELIPTRLRGQVLPGNRFFATVNVGATEPSELYFESFELAPEIDKNDGLG